MSSRYGRTITLGEVPDPAWDEVALPGVDAVWLMGVWERSPAGLEIALRDEALQASFRAALPDLRPEDVVGSPYCVRDYVVDASLGGPEGLAAARAQLASRGVRLILDYVPNHVAPDHPWLTERPGCLVQGTQDDLARDPAAFLEAGGKVFARGRDPYFAPWPDVVQLNAFSEELRTAAVDTLSAIADQADGVRCDMAMLLMTDVFTKTWGERAGAAPAEDFWPYTIPKVRERHPDFLFVAEAYWDLEWALQQQGFDHCYDKRLYDRLLHEGAESVRGHLQADVGYQRGLVRFLENHDEPRAAATLSPERERAAAVTIATLPGATLWHEGQFEGRRVRPPVFLGRRPEEPVDKELQSFQHQLLAAVASSGMRAEGVATARLHGLAGQPHPREPGRLVLDHRLRPPPRRRQPLRAGRPGPSPPPVARSAGRRPSTRRTAGRHDLRTRRRRTRRPGPVRRAGGAGLASCDRAALILTCGQLVKD